MVSICFPSQFTAKFSANLQFVAKSNRFYSTKYLLNRNLKATPHHSNRPLSVGGRKFLIDHNRKSKLRGKRSDAEGDSYYITTPIYYVNGEPHLGHAYTSVLCDVLARFNRKDGKDVYFLSGTDEHGQKVEQSAARKGKTAQIFADEVSNTFRNLLTELDCSHDDFIRTTESRHKMAVERLWNRLVEKDMIYLDTYDGWYSIRDEAFYSEAELIDGKAPTGAEVEWVKEESYFFRLSAFTDKLLQLYQEKPEFIGPKGMFIYTNGLYM